jgi:hypothetical protein
MHQAESFGRQPNLAKIYQQFFVFMVAFYFGQMTK